MSILSIDASAALAAAHRTWDTTGDIGTDHQYLQHLAESLIAHGWVRVHNHHDDDGARQRAQVAAALGAMHETPNTTYEDMASAAFVALLNPNHSKES